MANVKISNFPVPFALPVAASINGTETLPFDQTVSGVVTTRSALFSRLLGPISINSYANGGVTIAAPTSGNALIVSGLAGGVCIQVNSANGASVQAGDVTINRFGSTINTIAAGPCIQLFDATGNTATLWQNSGGQSELWQFNAAWRQNLAFTTGNQLSLPLATVTTTAPVAGGAGALPATPAGYMQITIAGTVRRIPFYT